VLYAEFNYHKMASVNSLLVIVLLLAVMFSEVIESLEGRRCYPSERSCAYLGGKSHYRVCHGYCQLQGKYADECSKVSHGCYGCKCYSSDILKSPQLSKLLLEQKPLLYLYILLSEYFKERRRTPTYEI